MRLNRSISGLLLITLLTLVSVLWRRSPTSASSTPGYSQTDVRTGSGAEVVVGSLLTVHYTGWLFDATKTDGKGLQFETSRGNTTPFSFTAGAGQVISGWDQGCSACGRSECGGRRRRPRWPTVRRETARSRRTPRWCSKSKR